MRFRSAIFAILFGLALSGTPSYAHHSVSAEFDLSRRITLQGRVSKIEWMNPHVYLYVDVQTGAQDGQLGLRNGRSKHARAPGLEPDISEDW